jgi:hypothetical protein
LTKALLSPRVEYSETTIENRQGTYPGHKAVRGRTPCQKLVVFPLDRDFVIGFPFGNALEFFSPGKNYLQHPLRVANSKVFRDLSRSTA